MRDRHSWERRTRSLNVRHVDNSARLCFRPARPLPAPALVYPRRNLAGGRFSRPTAEAAETVAARRVAVATASNLKETTKLSALSAEFENMKAVSKFVSLISVGVLSSVAAAAMTSEQFYVETCRHDPGIPVPISVVAPRVASIYEGTTVELEFIVDEAGNPLDVVVKSAEDFMVASLVKQAVQQWRFKPAELNGVPVPMKVVLPVNIFEDLPTVDLLAAKQ